MRMYPFDPRSARTTETEEVRHRQSADRPVYLRAGFACDLITFLTILASSTRKARRMLEIEYRMSIVSGVMCHRDAPLLNASCAS